MVAVTGPDQAASWRQ